MNKPRLFMLHYAGGSIYSYNFLQPYLGKFEIIPLELPGRGKRIKEPFVKDYRIAVKDYLIQINNYSDSKEFIIYGHSMGATLGLVIAKELEVLNKPPLCLIVSGNPGPGVKDDGIKRYLMSKHEFIAELKRLGGIPNEIIENEAFEDYFEPMLRADFEVVEKEKIFISNPVSVPIYACMGNEEEQSEYIDNWSNYTSGHFERKLFPGNHFFIHEYSSMLAKIINKSYERALHHAGRKGTVR